MKHFFLIIPAVFVLSFAGIAQDADKKQIRKLEKKGEELINIGDYYGALPVYEELYQSDTANPVYNFCLGVCYLMASPEENKATKNERAAFLLGRAYGKVNYIDAAYFLARAYHLTCRFAEAIPLYEAYNRKLVSAEAQYAYPDMDRKEVMTEVVRQIGMCRNGIDLMKDTSEIVFRNMGAQVNSAYPDYAPAISADDEVLVFTSRRPSGSKKDVMFYDYSYYEDVYITYKKDGEWTSAELIYGNVNTKKHDASIGLSPDAQKLFVYYSGDIYYSDLDGVRWTKPKSFGKEVNTRSWETHISMNAAQNVIYFVSDRRGGYGGRDIWMATLQADGKWSDIRNLGPRINTPYDEDAPFIHPNDKHLYFSSNGHNSMGGFDIFYSERDSAGEWFIPKNMGHPINSPDDDIYFTISSNGKSAYVAAVRKDGYGDKDIYLAVMPETGQVPLTVVRGIIRGEGGKPMQAKFKVRNADTGELMGIYQSNSASGKYLLVFPPDKEYEMLIDAPGYVAHQEWIRIPEQSRFYDLFQEIQLTPAYAIDPDNVADTIDGQKLVMRNAFFDIDSAMVTVDSSLRYVPVKEVAYSAFVGYLDDPEKKEVIAGKVKGKTGIDGMIGEYRAQEQIHLTEGHVPAGLKKEIYGFDTVFVATIQTTTYQKPGETTLALVTQPTHYVSQTELDTSRVRVDALLALSDINAHLDSILETREYVTLDELEKKLSEPVEQEDSAGLARADTKSAEEEEKKRSPVMTEQQGEADTEKATKTDSGRSSGSLGKKVILDNILFDHNSARLKAESSATLNKVFDLLDRNSDVRIELSGYTCSLGDENHNLDLSEKRAGAIADYLKRKGISAERLVAKGFGEARPIASNETASGRAMNRRTEIKVIGGPAAGQPAARNGEDSGNVQMVICTSVNDDREPQGSGNIFNKEIRRLYCFTGLYGMEGTIYHRWSVNNKPVDRIALNAGGPRWRTWSSKKVWEGQWKVEVLDQQENVLTTISFVVE